jgi:FkbM family methyltransferase
MFKSVARGVRAVLPRAVRERIGRAGRFFAPPAPFADVQAAAFPSVDGALRSLKARGFRPAFAVDVGAYHGELTVQLKDLFPDTKVLMVEAQEQKRATLEAICGRFGGSVECRIALLGPTSGERVRFVEMETGSSVYEEQSRYPRNASEKVTVALDEVTAGRRVDFLKLDVQGYELEVLRGAARCLAEAEAVLTEVSLVPVNRGAPLLADVVRFLDAAGFRVVDFCGQIRRKDGVLWQTDLLFVRAASPLAPDPRLTPENWW